MLCLPHVHVHMSIWNYIWTYVIISENREVLPFTYFLKIIFDVIQLKDGWLFCLFVLEVGFSVLAWHLFQRPGWVQTQRASCHCLPCVGIIGVHTTAWQAGWFLCLYLLSISSVCCLYRWKKCNLTQVDGNTLALLDSWLLCFGSFCEVNAEQSQKSY